MWFPTIAIMRINLVNLYYKYILPVKIKIYIQKIPRYKNAQKHNIRGKLITKTQQMAKAKLTCSRRPAPCRAWPHGGQSSRAPASWHSLWRADTRGRVERSVAAARRRRNRSRRGSPRSWPPWSFPRRVRVFHCSFVTMDKRETIKNERISKKRRKIR